ncbi:MAG TPA: MBL fold metallo-hydrolase [Dehalococcoidia bacterium]|nr:MBL fold metallo-hydrolase [Dehalococcoidia bacterium]
MTDLVALGQSGLWLRTGGAALAIDPYLSNSVQAHHASDAAAWGRAFAPPLAAGAVRVDAVACTHAHDDHCDPDTLRPLLAANPRALVYGPGPVVDVLRRAGLEPQARRTFAGRPIDVAPGLRLTAIPSAHYDFEPDASGEPAYVGFVVEAGDLTLYHAGDSLVYDGLAERLAAWRIDVACLPVNGRSADREARGITGNMDAAEAAALARRIGARLTVPLHNDLFPANSADWADVERAFAGVPLRRLAPGETMALGPGVPA